MFDPKDCDHVSMKEAQEREKANPLTEIARATSIAFVLMAEAGQIDDVTATENAGQFAAWNYPIRYDAGQIRRDPLDGNLYRVNEGQGHTSQQGWNPSLTPALWSKIGDPAEEWPPGPSPWERMTHTAPATRSAITANAGCLTWTGTSGSLGLMGGAKPPEYEKGGEPALLYT